MPHDAAGLIGDVLRAAGDAAAGLLCGRCGGLGRLEAVPGISGNRARSVTSSVFCELSITECAGSRVSSCCSPLVRSQSTEAPARKPFGAQQRFQRFVDFGHQVLFELLPHFERFAGDFGAVGSGRLLRGWLSRLPSISTTETASGASPSTALATRLVTARTFCGGDLRARPQFHHHAGFGRLLLIEKDRFLGKSQMNARLFHFGQAHHGALQFAFQRPLDN